MGQRQQHANTEMQINENAQNITIPSVLMFSLKYNLGYDFDGKQIDSNTKIINAD